MERVDPGVSSDRSFFPEGIETGRLHADLREDLGCVLAELRRTGPPPIGA